MALPLVSSVSPTSGPTDGGTTITIAGSGFTTPATVTLGGLGGAVATNVMINSPTEITAVTPAHSAGPVRVLVTTSVGTSMHSVSFSYIGAATVTAITPSSGPDSGGTEVTIAGSGFSDAVSVTLNGAEAAHFLISDTQISAFTPPHVPGPAQVVVITSSGPSSDAVFFTFVAPPAVTSVMPNSGPRSGGTDVTVTGADFTDVTAVWIDWIMAASFTADSPTTITAVTPAGVGMAQVVVAALGGASTDGVFFVYQPVPVVLEVTPSSGPSSGGTVVAIIGTGLTNATSVTFGGTVAAFFVDHDLRIHAFAPPRDPGPADVVVVTPGGTSTEPVTYTYS